MNYFLVQYNLLGLVFSKDDMPSALHVGVFKMVSEAVLAASAMLGGVAPAVNCYFVCPKDDKTRWLLIDETEMDGLLDELSEAGEPLSAELDEIS